MKLGGSLGNVPQKMKKKIVIKLFSAKCHHQHPSPLFLTTMFHFTPLSTSINFYQDIN
jgi:hypothetical protein